jgi:hypothetical protein
VRFRMLSTCVFLPQACTSRQRNTLNGETTYACTTAPTSVHGAVPTHAAVHEVFNCDEACTEARDDHIDGWQVQLSVGQAHYQKVRVCGFVQIKAERIRYRRAADVCCGQMVVDLNLTQPSWWLQACIPPASCHTQCITA